MIESGTRYEDLLKAHEKEEYRVDVTWMLEIESVGDSHLIKAVEMPELMCFGSYLVPEGGDLMKVVYRLPGTDSIEKKLADLVLGKESCKAALYMLRRDEAGAVSVCSTWLFEGFKPVKLKLQSFDRDRPSGLVELLCSCSFTSCKIV